MPVGVWLPEVLTEADPLDCLGRRRIGGMKRFEPHTVQSGEDAVVVPQRSALENVHHGSKWDEYGVRLGGAGAADRHQTDGPPESDREWCRGPRDGVVFQPQRMRSASR